MGIKYLYIKSIKSSHRLLLESLIWNALSAHLISQLKSRGMEQFKIHLLVKNFLLLYL